MSRGFDLQNALANNGMKVIPGVLTHASTASTRLGLISCILSSAFGDWSSNCWTASSKIDAGDTVPNRKTSSVTSGTFWRKSHTSLVIKRTPSQSKAY